MNSICPSNLGCAEQVGDIEVAVRSASRSHADFFVGQDSVERVPVALGEDSDRLKPKFSGRPDYSEGDLPPVGYKNFGKH